jgi:aryl-alcohol dehydrogenase-like predicted oxidoreductase
MGCTNNYNFKMPVTYPKIAIGTWSWGDVASGDNIVYGAKVNKAMAEEIFELAMGKNIFLWDTALMYGEGTAERVLAPLLKNYSRDDYLVSTKFSPELMKNYANMEEMCDESLNSLDLKQIDIYYIDNPKDNFIYAKQISELVEKKKIKKIGVSNHNLREVKFVDSFLRKNKLRVSHVQNHFSLLNRSSEESGLISYCERHNIKFFSYLVLEQGALTGKYHKKKLMPEKTERGEFYNKDFFTKIEPLLLCLRGMAEKYDCSMTTINIAYAIAKGTIPIVGCTHKAQIDDYIKAYEINLTEDDIKMLEEKADSCKYVSVRSWEKIMQ